MSETPDPRLTRRDAGLRRVRMARRWMAGGAVVLTGAFAGLAARGTHATATTSATGSAASPTSSSDSTSSSSSSRSESQSRSGDGATLQAPSSPPQASAAGPQASSGAS